MKKTLKKLWISRETLQALTGLEAQKVAGGSGLHSCLSGGCGATGGDVCAGGGTENTLSTC
jgi:hypothetical protein